MRLDNRLKGDSVGMKAHGGEGLWDKMSKKTQS